MNGDGIPDLVLNDEPFDIVFSPYFAVYFLAGKQDDTFGEPLLVSAGNVISQIIAGDLNQEWKTRHGYVQRRRPASRSAR